jgi:hypothetical protein
MRGKKFLSGFIVSVITVFALCTVAFADTILFPVIAVNQPNVTTIVSVFNSPEVSSSYLHFIYRTKCTFDGCGTSGNPNYAGSCVSQSFTRNTFANDIVSFDTSGLLNGGNALFNDPNTYNGKFDIGGTGARRAYLLVTNSNSGGTRINLGNNEALGGEAIVMDIAYGAAWGYKAVNDINREDYSFTQAGARTAIFGGGTDCKWFSFFPPDEWTTRFFVTPIGNNMDTANIASRIILWGWGSTRGIYTRGGSLLAFSDSVDLTCTAAVNLVDLIDATALASVQNIGGWAWLCEDAVNPITVYKLEYVVNDPVYGGTNNNGYLMSIDSAAW